MTTRILHQRVVEVAPLGILRVDEPNFPSSRPMLDGFLALNCEQDIVVVLAINENFESVALGKAFDQPLAVFEGSPRINGASL